MIILLKTTAGLNIETSKGTLKLKGFGLINEVSKDLWEEVKKKDSIKDLLNKGYLMEGGSSENAKSDTIEEVSTKQSKTKDTKVVKE